jgi:hypothetical protein
MVAAVGKGNAALLLKAYGKAAVETWTFRRGSSLLTFRRSTTRGPATELRFDTGGDHFILKRQ